MTTQKPTFQEVQNLSQQPKQKLYILFLTISLLFSTFFASAQTPYPCDKDSIDMATNELWLNQLEKLLPPLSNKLAPLTKNKEEILRYLKQRINCDTNRVNNQINFPYSNSCGLVRLRPQRNDTIYRQTKSSYIPLYVVNLKPIHYKSIHLIINSLQENQLITCWVLNNSKAKASAIFCIQALAGVVVMDIENILSQGKQIVLQKRKSKKNKLILHIQNKLKQSSVKIIFNPFINYLDNDTLLVSDYSIKLKKGKIELYCLVISVVAFTQFI
jgi:hypothetical protein